MILYLKDPKNSNEKLDTNQLTKSVAFLYTNDEQTEKEYRKIFLFKIVSKK
jgi:hypothetical protein